MQNARAVKNSSLVVDTPEVLVMEYAYFRVINTFLTGSYFQCHSDATFVHVVHLRSSGDLRRMMVVGQ